MARLRTKGTSLPFDPRLQDGIRGDPKSFDLDAIVAWVLGGMIQPEDLFRAVTMVFIEVGERDHVNRLVVTQDVPQLLFQVATLVLRIISFMHVSKVEENSTSIGQLDETGIGVADGEKPNNMHIRSLRTERRSTGFRPLLTTI